jgi:hypothetical protein
MNVSRKPLAVSRKPSGFTSVRLESSLHGSRLTVHGFRVS